MSDKNFCDHPWCVHKGQYKIGTDTVCEIHVDWAREKYGLQPMKKPQRDRGWKLKKDNQHKRGDER